MRIASANYVSTLAQQGFAVIAINLFGTGRGPAGTVILTDKSGNTTELPFGGRGLDLNGDSAYDLMEGCAVLAGPAPVGPRDCFRQSTVDVMQLIAAIKAGLDLTGDGAADIDPDRIHFFGGGSAGAYGTILLAMEPDLKSGALTSAPAPATDCARWSPVNRALGIAALGARVPPLLNKGRDFDEAYTLRDRPVKIIDIPGAVAIQEFFERFTWISAPGDALAYAPRLRWVGSGTPRRVLFQLAKGDQSVPNPFSSNLVRAADMRELTSLYRHDLARQAAPELPQNPVSFLTPTGSPAQLAIAFAGQRQIAEFLASDEWCVPDVNSMLRALFGLDLFEVPDRLPDDLNW